MITNMSISAFVLLCCCTMAKDTLKISNYTGAGVSTALQTQILRAITNAYNKYKTGSFPEQTQSISQELEQSSNYYFTVLITNEVPEDSWFTVRTEDDIYAVWSGVNKMQITWTYYILATGQKSEVKTKNMFFYWGVANVVGKGVSSG